MWRHGTHTTPPCWYMFDLEGRCPPLSHTHLSLYNSSQGSVLFSQWTDSLLDSNNFLVFYWPLSFLFINNNNSNMASHTIALISVTQWRSWHCNIAYSVSCKVCGTMMELWVLILNHTTEPAQFSSARMGCTLNFFTKRTQCLGLVESVFEKGM